MVNTFPAVQLSTLDQATSPEENVMIQTKGLGIVCQNGVTMQDVTLAPASSNVAPAFPTDVTTALVICIVAITTTDLIVKVGSGTPVSLSLPANQGLLLYNVASSAITLNSILGGQVQYAIGG